MFTPRIGKMGIRVTLIMNMFLHINYIYGTYIFEKDVSQMTGVGTAKEWLVFMEIRIKHCMKIRKMSRYAWGDLVGLTRCLATVRTEPQPRCYRDKYKWKVWLHASHHISIWRRIWKQHIHCKWITPLNFTALVMVCLILMSLSCALKWAIGLVCIRFKMTVPNHKRFLGSILRALHASSVVHTTRGVYISLQIGCLSNWIHTTKNIFLKEI